VNAGTVEAIYIAPVRGEPTEYVEQAHVIPGMGIEGDRFFDQPGPDGIHSKPGRELTLIQIEAIESICNQDGIAISPDQTRRNIITRGVSLNDLVGQDFMIGSVRVHGVRLCEPCDYLASRTDPRILLSMAHRGGLRANILTEGMINIQDKINSLPSKDFYD
jgi:MOSC domain-containing protein YiiM